MIHKVSITKLVRLLPLSERKIRNLVRTIFTGEKIKNADLSIAVVGDKRMSDLAEQYARRRYRTDVFAFDLSDDPDLLVGQIVVNSQLARQQAGKLKTDPAAELALYITHGLLHLLGYDDHHPKQALAMHRKSKRYLQKAGFKQIPPLPDVRKK